MASDGTHKMAQPSGPISGVYDVHEKLPSGEGLPFVSDSLFLADDDGSAWGYLGFNQITGMFRVWGLPPRRPSGNIGTFCRCRVDDGDGKTRIYDGSMPAPC